MRIKDSSPVVVVNMAKKKHRQQQQQQRQQQQQSAVNGAAAASDDEQQADGLKHCAHINKSVTVNSVKKSLKKTQFGHCQSCNEENLPASTDDCEPASVYMCLQCGHQGCDRSTAHKHALAHYKTEHSIPHDIALCLETYAVWCYACDDYVTSSVSKKLQECIDIVRRYSVSLEHTLNPVKIYRPTSTSAAASGLTATVTTTTTTNTAAAAAANCSIDTTTTTTTAKLTTPVAHSKVKGLANLGNTCFFNAVLQILRQTHLLEAELRECNKKGQTVELLMQGCDLRPPVDLQTVRSSMGLSDGDQKHVVLQLSECGPMTRVLLNVFDDMSYTTNSTPKQQTYVNPSSLFNQVCSRASRFKGFQQQDSHELLRYLLDALKAEEIKRSQLAILKLFNADGTKVKDLSDEHKNKIKELGRCAKQTFVDRVFGGIFISTIVCHTCHHSTQMFEAFLDLSVPIVDDKTESSGKNEQHQHRTDSKVSSTTPTQHAADATDNKQTKNMLKRQQKLARKQSNRTQKNRHSSDATNSPTTHCDGDQTLKEQSAEVETSQGQSTQVKSDNSDESDVEGCSSPEITSEVIGIEKRTSIEVSSIEMVGDQNDIENSCIDEMENAVSSNVDGQLTGRESVVSDTEQAGGECQHEANVGSIDCTVGRENPAAAAANDDVAAAAAADGDDGVAAAAGVSYENIVPEPCDLVPAVDRAGSPQPPTDDLAAVSSVSECSAGLVDNCTSHSMSQDVITGRDRTALFSQLVQQLSSQQTDKQLEDNDTRRDEQTFRSGTETPSDETFRADLQGTGETLQTSLATPGAEVLPSGGKDETIENCSAKQSFNNNNNYNNNNNNNNDSLKQVTATDGDIEDQRNCSPADQTGADERRRNAVLAAMEPVATRYTSNTGECSVMSCLSQFTAVETLSGNNMLMCSNCNRSHNTADGKVLSCASKQLLIYVPPAVLTLHLKRFQQVGFNLRKLTHHVAFTELLDLAPFCSKLHQAVYEPASKLLYSLYGVVEHSGTLRNGHYTAFVKLRPSNLEHSCRYLQSTLADSVNIDELVKSLHALRINDGDTQEQSCNDGDTLQPVEGRWFHISDTSVSEVKNVENVLKCQAYLLFYERIM